MAKYAAAEAACDAADRAVQAHGGNGITQEYGVAGLLVAARAGRIAPVSREMILNFVGMHSLACQVLLMASRTASPADEPQDDRARPLPRRRPRRVAGARQPAQPQRAVAPAGRASCTTGWRRAEADDDVKVVLIRAEGRTFCSGADLSEASADGMEQAAGVLVELQRRIVTLPKPVVTRVHGNVRAGGIGIVAASDIAISAARRDVRLHRGPARPHPGRDLADRAAPDDRPRRGADLPHRRRVHRPRGRADGPGHPAVAEDELNARGRRDLRVAGQGQPAGPARDQAAARPAPRRADRRRTAPDLAKLSARLFGSEEAQAAMLAFLNRKK